MSRPKSKSQNAAPPNLGTPSKRLTVNELLILTYALNIRIEHAIVWLHVPTLGEDLKIPQPTVRNTLDRLVARGILVRHFDAAAWTLNTTWPNSDEWTRTERARRSARQAKSTRPAQPESASETPSATTST